MAPTMVSYQLVEFKQPFTRVVKPMPQPSGAQVILAVEYCGLCHSDLHLQQGNLGLLPGDAAIRGRPRTLGHEPMGRVAAVGPDAVGKLAVGDRVVAYPFIGCGECTLCTVDGMDHLCFKRAVGFVADGGFASHIVIPHYRYLFPIGHIPPQLAAVSACAGLTAFSSIRKMGITGDPKHPVLVIGAGGVGMMALHLFKLMYPAHPGPIVVDLDASKLASVTEQGLCSRAIQIGKPGEDAAKLLRKESGAGGFTGVLDFVGNPTTVKLALDTVQKGGRVVVTGLFGGTMSLPTVTFPSKAISVHGVFVGSMAEFRELLALLERSKPLTLPMHERPLAQASAALQDLHDGKIVGRVVLNATNEATVASSL